MYNRIKLFFLIGMPFFLLVVAGCKKGTFDINSPNPNIPSSVAPKFVLSAALTASASLVQAGSQDFADLYMGYFAISGDYIPTFTTLTYHTTTDYFAGNWDVAYTLLQNYKYIITVSQTDSSQANFLAIAKIMTAFHFSRLVDMYNDIPYSQALNGGTINYPKFDDAKSVYMDLLHQLDTSIIIINNAPLTAATPGNYDPMFGGDMTEWIHFANTVKLRMLMNLTQTADGSSTITSELAGLTSADFLGAGEDAIVNPGYSSASYTQQSPIWQDLGYSTAGSPQNNNSYYRACTYAVNFYTNNNDPRLTQLYSLNASNVVQGRAFGSTALEHNSAISAVGLGLPSAFASSGLRATPSDGAVLLPAAESFFLQAEAAQRGFLSGGDPVALYEQAVTESFRILGLDAATAQTYYTQAGNDDADIETSGNPLQTIIVQKWASLNTFDPLESWSDWRRLGIPTDLPISIYPGTTASHVPYRLLYPTSEYSYNGTNVQAEGTIDNLASKIFWMP